MVKFHQVELLEEGAKLMKIESVKYKVFAADSRFNLKRESRCGISGPVAEKQVSDNKAYLEVNIDLFRLNCLKRQRRKIVNQRTFISQLRL